MNFSHQVPFGFGELGQTITVFLPKKMKILMYVLPPPSTCIITLYMQIDDFKTHDDQRGISIDADVALWLHKLEIDGTPQLPQFQNFVLLTREQHNQLDEFKKSHPQQTMKGFSMFQLTPLLKFWNSHRDSPSPAVAMFHKYYLQLSSTEVDTLCDWIIQIRNAYSQ